MEKRLVSVAHDKFEPFGEEVLISAFRVESKIILPGQDDPDKVMYQDLKVVAYGDKTRYVRVGDSVKMSEWGIKVTPEYMWGEGVEGDTDSMESTNKVDYLLISEAYIKGRWIDEVEED